MVSLDRKVEEGTKGRLTWTQMSTGMGFAGMRRILPVTQWVEFVGRVSPPPAPPHLDTSPSLAQLWPQASQP